MGESIGPFDQIRQMAPWYGPKPSQPWDVLQADGVLQFYGWRDLVFQSWAHGTIPFWNPFELCGTPLLANSQSAPLYPGHILMGLLHIPTSIAVSLLAWFHLFVAGWGVAKLSERLGASKTGGAVGGSSFALSAFMLGWTGLSSVITTVCWIPWVLLGIACLFQGDPSRRAKVRGVVLLAVATALMTLAGHLQFVAYGYMAAIAFLVWFMGQKSIPSRAKSLGFAILAMGLGAAIAAPQLLPVLKFGEFSHRKGAPTEEGYQAYVASAIKPFELANTGYAMALGNPRTTADGDIGVSTYWPAVAKQGGNFTESAVALGPLILSLLFMAPWKKKGRLMGGVALVGSLALLLALGTLVNILLYNYLPGWSSTGSPGRVIGLFVMSACVLGGIAFSNLGPLPEKGSARYIPLLLPAILTIGLISLGSLAQPPEQLAEAVGVLRSQAIRNAAPGLLASVLFATAGLLVTLHPVKAYTRIIQLLAPVGVALASGSLTIVPTGLPLASVETSHSNGSAAYERFAFVNQGWDLLVAAPGMFPPNTALSSRLHDVAGYDSLLHRDTKALLDDINGQDSAPPANGNMMFIKPTFDAQKLAGAGVTEVWSRKPLEQMDEPYVYSENWVKYKLSGPGRADVAGKPAEIEKESGGYLQILAEGPGVLTIRERNMPGWHAMTEGRELEIKGDPWIEVELPPGKHSVDLAYIAPGFKTGLSLAIPAFILLGLMILFMRRESGQSGT